MDSAVRDRLNELAAAEGLTAGSLVEKLLDDYLWQQRVELAKQQMRNSPQEVWDEYWAEFHSMDASMADGLEGWGKNPFSPVSSRSLILEQPRVGSNPEYAPRLSFRQGVFTA